ncbi:MAG: M48 family metallopeptidase [Opitutaceae bacterium]
MQFELSDGSSVPVELRRRKGNRYLRLRIGRQNQVVLSAPLQCSEKDVLAFAEKNRSWIEKQLAKAPQQRTLSDWFAEHPYLSVNGDLIAVRIERVSDSIYLNYKFEVDGSELVLLIPEEVDSFERCVLQLVRHFAKDALDSRVAYHAERLDLRYTKLGVRDQSSRWGSCSESGSISLNWRLILLAPELQDYVILHELAHLTEMNHSTRFWALLDRYDPARKAHEVQINQLAAEVMRVGRI